MRLVWIPTKRQRRFAPRQTELQKRVLQNEESGVHLLSRFDADVVEVSDSACTE